MRLQQQRIKTNFNDMHVVHNNGKTVNLANPRMKFFRDRLEDLFNPIATELKTHAIP